MQTIAIIGAGAWGTALAEILRATGRNVVIWAREAEVVDALNERHENTVFLPGIRLDPPPCATGDILRAVEGSDAVLLVVPAQFCRATAGRLAGHLPPHVPLVLCAKGIEKETGLLVSEAVAEVLPDTPQAVLSGPTFAAEVARGLPTAVTLAATDEALGARLVEALGSPGFRPYLTDDVIGAQVGGAVKNVLAIACGIAMGRALGDSARAALVTRGLAEMTRLTVALGGRAATCMGLSGLGDLTLTCTSTQSRNTSLGVALGQGQSLEEIKARRRSVAEGIDSAAAVLARARRAGVEMPICAGVDAVLNRGAAIDETIDALLARPFTTEGP